MANSLDQTAGGFKPTYPWKDSWLVLQEEEGVANTLVPIPIKYRAAVSHTRLTFPIEIKTAGRSGVRIYEPRNDSERSCGKGGLLLPSAGSALCVEGNGSDKTGLRVRQ